MLGPVEELGIRREACAEERKLGSGELLGVKRGLGSEMEFGTMGEARARRGVRGQERS